jgi:hypothetical protein
MQVEMYKYYEMRFEVAVDSGGPPSVSATELISSNCNVSGLYLAGRPTWFEIRLGHTMFALNGFMLAHSPAGKRLI